jgi:hypothetical protein
MRYMQILAVLMLTASVSFAAEASRNFEKTFDASTLKKIRIASSHGSVTVQGKEDIESIRVRVYIRVKANDQATAVQMVGDMDVRMKVRRKTLHLTTIRPKANISGWSGTRIRERLIRVDVEVPMRMVVECRSSHGPIVANDVKHMGINSSHGSIKVSNAGSVKVKSSHGSVTLSNISGIVDLKNDHGSTEGYRLENLAGSYGHGSVKLEDQRGWVSLKGNHGSVKIEYRKAVKEMKLSVGHGSVTVDMPRNSDIKLRADVEFGSVLVRNLKHIEDTKSSGTTRLIIGSGPVDVDLKTRHGSVRINGER